MLSYIGNGPYCYANAASMLLSAIGEEIPPPRIEVLTGVGLGAFWLEEPKLLFFSNLEGAPDKGLSRALELLGFEFVEGWSEESGSAPFDDLRAVLAEGPAVLGPLDMGYLSYNPSHENAGGADHYVLAYGLDDRDVHIHDPEGFPHVRLSLDQLEKAWRAELIGYRRGYYRYWTSPRRVRQPSQGETYDEAISFFQTLYIDSEDAASRMNWRVGKDAILALASHVEEGSISPEVETHLVFFAFKLGARRALDFAAFFDSRNSSLADLKREQAELFGEGHTEAALQDWGSLANVLRQLASSEESFRAALLDA